MPKVTNEYIEHKKECIIDAALEVCKYKTLSSVTMQDIINASGLSQGGIYHFYENIDVILGDLLNRIRRVPAEDQKVDKVLEKYTEQLKKARLIEDEKESRIARRNLIKESVFECHQLMADNMKKYLFPYYKIEFEYNILITDYPERAKKIYSIVKYDFVINKMNQVICNEYAEEVRAGTVIPLVSLEEFIQYNGVVYDGILKRAIAKNCYERHVSNNKAFEYDIDARFQTMCLSTLHLMGIDK